MVKMSYIVTADTCPPSYWLYRCRVTGLSLQHAPPVLQLPVALLRLSGVPPHAR